MKITATVTTEITDERLKDLLCSAFEGGSNYWIDHCDIPPKSTWPAQAEYWHELPVYGTPITVLCDDAPMDNRKRDFLLTQNALQTGMQIMSEKYPLHYGNFIAENDDAETGDVFLQCCLFGDIIFG